MAPPDLMCGSSPARPMALLERDEPLATLARALTLSREHGKLAVISGEAGIGKSTLLEAFARSKAADTEFFRGGCHALKTASPLGPLLDIAADLRGQTAQRLAEAAARHELFAAFVEDLTRRDCATVVIFEDVHWADEATLDLLTYV